MKKRFEIEWKIGINLYARDIEAILDRANILGMNKFKVTELPLTCQCPEPLPPIISIVGKKSITNYCKKCSKERG